MHKLVSILMPVYNSEDFIERALDSILEQTYKNLDIVVLDDGSTDNTRKILRSYEKKDSRIRVIYKEKNYGVSNARLELINNSLGEFLMFCDSDDYMDTNTVEKVMDKMSDNKVDCVIFKVKCIKKGFSHEERNTYLRDGLYSKDKISRYYLKNPRSLLWGSLCNKCYKSEIIKVNNIKFSKNLEDVIFNIKYFKYINYCYIISDCYYYYNQTNISMTRGSKKNQNSYEIEKDLLGKWNAFSEAFSYIKDTYRDIELSRRDKVNLYNYLYSVYLDIEYISKNINSNNIINEIKKYSNYQELIINLKGHISIIRFRYKLKKVKSKLKNLIIKIASK